MAARYVYTVEEIRHMLDLSRGSVYEALRRNAIPHRKIGRRYVIPRAEFLRWLGENVDLEGDRSDERA